MVATWCRVMSDSQDVGAGSDVSQSGHDVVAPLIVQLTATSPGPPPGRATARDPCPRPRMMHHADGPGGTAGVNRDVGARTRAAGQPAICAG